MLFDVGFSGFNVTIPHKEQALAFADDMSSRSRNASAQPIHLIKTDSGNISADNTDGYGFITNLASQSDDLATAGWPVFGAGSRWRCASRFWLLFWTQACQKFTFAIEREHGLMTWPPTYLILLK